MDWHEHSAKYGVDERFTAKHWRDPNPLVLVSLQSFNLILTKFMELTQKQVENETSCVWKIQGHH